MSKDSKGRLIQQAIYDEAEKGVASQKVRERFKAVPYYMRKSRENTGLSENQYVNNQQE